MSIVDRIKHEIRKKGSTIAAVERDLGFGNGTIGKWDKQSPSCNNMLRLANYLSVSVDYLLTGEAYPSTAPNLNDDEQELLSYYKKLSEINKGRILGNAQALSGAFEKPLEESPNTIFIEQYLLPVSAGTGVYLDNCDKEMIEVEENELTLEANFALRVSGDSMEPDFKDGDVLIIRSQPTVKVGEIGIFILDGEGYVKEFGGDCLISHNKKYENIKLNEYSEIYCRGLVLGVL